MLEGVGLSALGGSLPMPTMGCNDGLSLPGLVLDWGLFALPEGAALFQPTLEGLYWTGNLRGAFTGCNVGLRLVLLDPFVLLVC